MTPSFGLTIGLPVAGVVLLVAAIVTVVLIRWPQEDWGRDDPPKGCFVAGAIAFMIAISSMTAAFMYPFDSDYHWWKPTSGTVMAVESRLLGGGENNAVTQRFVVTFTDGRLRACDDTRCATVKPGNVLRLTCKRSFQWTGTDGYDCNFVGVKPA